MFREDEAFTWEPALNTACSVQIQHFHQVSIHRPARPRIDRVNRAQPCYAVLLTSHSVRSAAARVLFQRAAQSLARRIDAQMARRQSLSPLHQLFELGLCCIPNVLPRENVHEVYNAIVHTFVDQTHGHAPRCRASCLCYQLISSWAVSVRGMHV